MDDCMNIPLHTASGMQDPLFACPEQDSRTCATPCFRFEDQGTVGQSELTSVSQPPIKPRRRAQPHTFGLARTKHPARHWPTNAARCPAALFP
jgi:hypothetical protein